MNIAWKTIKIVLLIASIIFIYAYIEPYWLRVRDLPFNHPDVPDNFVGKRIVFFSDIHLGPFFSRRRLQQLVETANRLEPDIILLGGDYVHQGRAFIPFCFNELKNLKAKYGVFAVLGNHDHWESARSTSEYMKKANITLLRNNSLWIGDSAGRIKIGGVGDFWEDTQNSVATTHDVKNQDFVVLISHNPDYVETLGTQKIDLVLSGHTHGGQLTLFGLYSPFVPSLYGQKYRLGLMKKNSMSVFITTGVGTLSTPLRFFARPEIVQITLGQGDRQRVGVQRPSDQYSTRLADSVRRSAVRSR